MTGGRVSGCSPFVFNARFEVRQMDSRYQQALDYIYSFIDYERQPGPRTRATYDLRRMDELLGRLDNPHLKPRTVHIAGSKGKGSVAAMVASALTTAGYTTGLFTSPHLHVLNERMRVDWEMISDEELVALVDEIRLEIEAVNRAATYGTLTTFEILTALGFVYFARKKVDFQVIEVGLGGRLDATNVVHPEVCVITSISLEHTEVLGNTLAEIAVEKAGIIKDGIPVVTSPQVEEVDRVFEEVCRTHKAELIRIGRDVTWHSPRYELERQLLQVKGQQDSYALSIPLLGQYQLDNAAVAVAALEVLAGRSPKITVESIQNGLSKVQWEGRLQILSHRPLIVVDGAHNTDSVRRLRQSLEHYFDFDRAILIIGLSADKDLSGVVSELALFFDWVIVTRSIHPRAMATAPIVAEFARHGIEAAETDDISIALPLALDRAGDRDLICVTGSLFVVAGAIEQAELLSLPA
ncbi:MAG: bifunctional folylpolyglutamate synthase/dihydrofolate synthase [Dehalococcoidales bacterium]|nr:MAG: bifunctional folylpolyglutamate synthase/dihydrofolate synthase [Dehalococcoidales bacterium]